MDDPRHFRKEVSSSDRFTAPTVLEDDADRLPPQDLVGKRFGRLRLERLLGRGGMGEVYEGYDETLHRKVAVKTIRVDHRLHDEARARFLREARVLSALDHPNICRLYDYLTTEETDLLVLELIEGESLAELLAREDASLESRRMRIAQEVLDALVAAHKNGIIHRDLKPGNVMITADGTVKVLDFGLARALGSGEPELPPVRRAADASELETGATVALAAESLFEADFTAGGIIVGTPHYMSPEQARGEALGPASDLFSYGLLLQVLFGGPAPYRGAKETSEILERAQRGDSLPPTDVPKPLAGLVQQLKAVEPKSRPTAAETAQRLRFIAGRKRRAVRYAVAAVLVLFLALGFAKYVTDLRRERNEAEAARAQAEGVANFLVSLFEQSDPAQARGDVLTARQLLDDGAVRVRTELLGEPAVQARVMKTIGDVYQKLGALEEAEALLTESLEIRERELGPDHLEVADSLSGLGYFFYLTGRYGEAIAHFERGLAIRERHLGGDALDVGNMLNDLAIPLVVAGRRDEALAAFDRALRIRRTHLGREHELVAQTLNNKSVALHYLGRNEEALEVGEEALALRRRILPPDHPDLAETLSSVGTYRIASGDPAAALGLLSEAVQIREKVFGPSHSLVAESLSNQAGALLRLGQYDEAEGLWQRCLEIWTEAFGASHPHVGLGLAHLANTANQRGDYELARERAQASLDIRVAALGPEHPQVAESLAHLVTAERGLGLEAAAQEHLEQALAIAEGASDEALAERLRRLGEPAGRAER